MVSAGVGWWAGRVGVGCVFMVGHREAPPLVKAGRA